MTVGWGLIFTTFLLVVAAFLLFTVYEAEWWAQLLLVLASGTAGCGTILILEEKR